MLVLVDNPSEHVYNMDLFFLQFHQRVVRIISAVRTVRTCTWRGDVMERLNVQTVLMRRIALQWLDVRKMDFNV
jgi:hypothetical protein